MRPAGGRSVRGRCGHLP